MYILLSLWAAVAGARVPCEDDFLIDRPALYRLEAVNRESHLLSFPSGPTSLGQLSESARAIVDAAEVVVFESRPNGRPPTRPRAPLSAVLSAEAWATLVDGLVAKGVPAWAINDLSPALAHYLLEVDPAELTGDRLDRELRLGAESRGLAARILETNAQQERLADAWFGVADLERALRSPGGSGAPDLARLKRERPDAYRRLVTERYAAWSPKIRARHGSASRILFVINHRHLVGPDGLLRHLKAAGFLVRRIE